RNFFSKFPDVEFEGVQNVSQYNNIYNTLKDKKPGHFYICLYIAINLLDTKDYGRHLLSWRCISYVEYSSEDVARAVVLNDDGRSVRYIANALNMPRSTVYDAIKRYRETEKYARRPGSGRQRATIPNEGSWPVSKLVFVLVVPSRMFLRQYAHFQLEAHSLVKLPHLAAGCRYLIGCGSLTWTARWCLGADENNYFFKH
ncbi:hypothetical protein C0J52_21847, partial [Blattella germanica]